MTVERDRERVAAEEESPVAHGRGRMIAAVVAGVVLLGLGAFGGAALSERRHARERATAPPSPGEASSPTGHAGPAIPARTQPPSEEPLEVTLTPEALQRAGIKIVAVRTDVVRGTLAVPATVTSNAYRDTKVNALVGGVVRHVGAELGAAVRRGQPLAVIFSGELADAQMRYLSMRATYEADHKKLERTRRLVDVGAASRQELEEVTALHDAHETEVAAARQRLILLGLSAELVSRLPDASHIVSELTVPSPADGVVIARAINPGQVVTAGQDLFVVTDLGTVWVIGDVYESDVAKVRVGTAATVTVPSAPGRARHGRVAYIDPRVDPATRTAKVRVEVLNPDTALRLGMFVELALETGAGSPRILVPRAAVQAIGGRAVVYVATQDEGRFVERPVRLGRAGDGDVEVLEGLVVGERVVADGSFLVRAEAGRARPGS